MQDKIKPSEMEYEVGQRVIMRRGGPRAKRSVYIVQGVKSWRTRWGTPVYALTKESNGFPTSASAADIEPAPDNNKTLPLGNGRDVLGMR